MIKNEMGSLHPIRIVYYANTGTSPGATTKYNSVHMRDQNFSKTPRNEFLLPDENHPLNEVT